MDLQKSRSSEKLNEDSKISSLYEFLVISPLVKNSNKGIKGTTTQEVIKIMLTV